MGPGRRLVVSPHGRVSPAQASGPGPRDPDCGKPKPDPGNRGRRLAWTVAPQESLPSCFLRKQEFFLGREEGEAACDEAWAGLGSGRPGFLSKVWDTRRVPLALPIVFAK